MRQNIPAFQAVFIFNIANGSDAIASGEITFFFFTFFNLFNICNAVWDIDASL